MSDSTSAWPDAVASRQNPEAIRVALLALEALEPGPESRFWSQVRVRGECWEWQGSLSYRPNGERGYGKFQYRGVVGAHRVAYTLSHGPIPVGCLVMHTCDNPPCVRPDHLTVGTVTDNNEDRHRKGRSRGASAKTHCPKGHPYDAANTVRNSNGDKICAACRTEYNRMYKAER